MYKKTFLSIACATFMIGCGSSVEMTTIDGKVADGYLVGVKVFMDMNENGLFDIGEPSAVTTKGGEFSLNVPKDNSNHPIIAIVNSNAVDEDNNQPIGKDFKMIAPAGETFISPLTSLVQELIESKSVDIQTATKEIASQLSLADQEDEILKDYIANNNDRLHNIAKAVIEAKFKVLEDLNTYTKSNVSQNIDLSLVNSADADFSSANYGYDANSLDSFLNNQVIDQLNTISLAVDGIDYDNTNSFEEALKEAVYNALGNIDYDYTDFTQEVKVSEPVSSVNTSSESENSADGTFNLEDLLKGKTFYVVWLNNGKVEMSSAEFKEDGSYYWIDDGVYTKISIDGYYISFNSETTTKESLRYSKQIDDYLVFDNMHDLSEVRFYSDLSKANEYYVELMNKSQLVDGRVVLDNSEQHFFFVSPDTLYRLKFSKLDNAGVSKMYTTIIADGGDIGYYSGCYLKVEDTTNLSTTYSFKKLNQTYIPAYCTSKGCQMTSDAGINNGIEIEYSPDSEGYIDFHVTCDIVVYSGSVYND